MTLTSANGLRVAIVGATGLVGEMVARVLDERRFPMSMLRAFGTARSAGTQVSACGCSVAVESLDETSEPFADIDVAFFSAGDAVSARYVPLATAAGAFVVDKSGVYRLDAKTPLIVPEANAAAVGSHTLVANPNCSTIPLAVALAPIERAFGLAWVSVATYQSVSGAGKDAVTEYDAQLRGADAISVLPRRIAGNVIPEVGGFDGFGDADEERKIAAELRKILARPDLPVSATCVRVPVSRGHSEAVSFLTMRPAKHAEIREVLRAAPGVRFNQSSAYTTPLEIEGTDDVAVGRLRDDGAHPGAHLCWIVCDNLRKGAATNAVQIVECALRAARVPA